jgi:FAD:protein FMN transferase
MTSLSRDARRARPALGTLVEMRVPDTADAPAAFESAFAAVGRVHRLMSRQEADSDVSRLNRAAPGALMAIDGWTFQVLQRAKALHAASRGLFDCAAAPGLDGSLADLELPDECRVRLRQPLAISLDGIAKGYAVDRAVEALRLAGASAGVVNAGGDLRVFGDEPQAIHVRHPRNPGSLVLIGAVREAAVATSGRYFGNSSLVDPRTRRARASAWSATVVARDCTTADALTKPCLLDRGGARELTAACDACVVLLH